MPKAVDGWKVCSRCGVRKEATEENFGKSPRSSDGFSGMCRECCKMQARQQREVNPEASREASRRWKEKNREYSVERALLWNKTNPERRKATQRKYSEKYRQEHREELQEKNKKYRQEHKDEIREKHKAYREMCKLTDPDKVQRTQKQTRERLRGYYREYARSWRAGHKELLREYRSKYYENNRERRREHCRQRTRAILRGEKGSIPLMKRRMRNMISRCLNERGYAKYSRTRDILGCTYEELLAHLGPKPAGDTHIDHVAPCAQAQTEEELLKLQHYTNLRWLPAIDNICKSSNRTPEGEEMCRKLLGREWIESHPATDKSDEEVLA